MPLDRPVVDIQRRMSEGGHPAEYFGEKATQLCDGLCVLPWAFAGIAAKRE